MSAPLQNNMDHMRHRPVRPGAARAGYGKHQQVDMYYHSFLNDICFFIFHTLPCVLSNKYKIPRDLALDPSAPVTLDRPSSSQSEKNFEKKKKKTRLHTKDRGAFLSSCTEMTTSAWDLNPIWSGRDSKSARGSSSSFGGCLGPESHHKREMRLLCSRDMQLKRNVQR